MIAQILDINHSLRLQHRFLRKSVADNDILGLVDSYLVEYCNFYNISANEAANAIEKFSERYQKDLNNFIVSSRYPYELGDDQFKLTRTEYDLFLIGSMLFTKHRFTIAKKLHSLNFNVSSLAFIGVGSGIEIELIGNKCKETYAYDIELSSFVKSRFKTIRFHETLFTNTAQKLGAIVAIELLEHLHSYMELVRYIHGALSDDGIFVCTIAKNVPQFDHLENIDAMNFEKSIEPLFGIVDKERIAHDYKLSNTETENVFYILKKKAQA